MLNTAIKQCQVRHVHNAIPTRTFGKPFGRRYMLDPTSRRQAQKLPLMRQERLGDDLHSERDERSLELFCETDSKVQKLVDAAAIVHEPNASIAGSTLKNADIQKYIRI